MEKPIINTTAPRMHYPLAVGSGSFVRKVPEDDIARPTSFVAPDNVLYLLTGMLYGYTGGSSIQVRLREKSADPIGTWLVSTDEACPAGFPWTFAKPPERARTPFRPQPDDFP